MKSLVIVIMSIFLIIFSCDKKKESVIKIADKNKEIDSPISISDTAYNAMGAYIFKASDGTKVLNWSQAIDTSGTQLLKYKIFDPKTERFSNTKTVASSIGMQAHHESMSKIGKTKEGIYFAVFRFKKPTPENRFAGAIYYALSEDGEKWSEKKKLVTEENATSQSFYDIVLLPDGELGMSWLDSRKIEKDKDGSTLYFAKTKGKEGFVIEKPIAGSTCQCCRTDIFVDNQQIIHVGYRNIIESTKQDFTKGQIRDMYRVFSKDNGETFSESMPMGKDYWEINGCPHTGPSFADNSKKVAVAWFTGSKTGAGIFFKDLSDLYKKKKLLSEIGRHPQMIDIPNGDFLIVYEDAYTIGKQVYNHIVLHRLKDDGTETKKVISLYNTKNDHAVITKINDSSILVAWTNEDNNKSKIVYRIIHF